MLVLTRKPSETILVGDQIRITLVKIEVNKVRLGIEAPANVPIRREEIAPTPLPVKQVRELLLDSF